MNEIYEALEAHKERCNGYVTVESSCNDTDGPILELECIGVRDVRDVAKGTAFENRVISHCGHYQRMQVSR